MKLNISRDKIRDEKQRCWESSERGEEGKVGWSARKETRNGAWGSSRGKVRSETLLNKRCVVDRMNPAPQVE